MDAASTEGKNLPHVESDDLTIEEPSSDERQHVVICRMTAHRHDDPSVHEIEVEVGHDDTTTVYLAEWQDGYLAHDETSFFCDPTVGCHSLVVGFSRVVTTLNHQHITRRECRNVVDVSVGAVVEVQSVR